MGVMVMALFRPKSGGDDAFMACMRDHLPVLRGQGLATDRPSIVLRASDGTLVEIFEWASQAAIDAAHANAGGRQAVGALRGVLRLRDARRPPGSARHVSGLRARPS